MITTTSDSTTVDEVTSGGDDPRSSDRRHSQRALIWRAFRRNRLAMVGLVITAVIYLVAIFAEFLAPTTTDFYNPDYTYAPPQVLHLDLSPEQGEPGGLYVNGYVMKRNPETLELTFEVDESSKVPVGLFVHGQEYRLFGLIPSDIHLVGPVQFDPERPVYLLGADRLGRDLLSRLIMGTRVSMSIGLIGVAMSFVFGIVLGGISGYVGGRVDTIIQRFVEFAMSLPALPLWMGLAAAIPSNWDPLQRYFAITVVLSFISWTGLARVVRGRFMALREEQFVAAARLDGVGQPRIILSHILPSMTSHLIAAMTLAIPHMILAETGLSFLGLGLQAPVVSWGVLLQEAQQIRVIATAPWLLIPGLAVVVAVLSLNFLGDGLRDAADPYSS